MKYYSAGFFIAVLLTGCSSPVSHVSDAKVTPVAFAQSKPSEPAEPPQADTEALNPSTATLDALFMYVDPKCSPNAARRKMVRAKHIVVEPADWSVGDMPSLEDWKAAYAKAQAARTALLNGARFETLQNQLSKHATSRGGKGGDLGFFTQGAMKNQIERVAFCLPLGQLSPVVRTNFGFHIVEVTAVRY